MGANTCQVSGSTSMFTSQKQTENSEYISVVFYIKIKQLS